MLATRLVSSFAIRVELLLYCVHELLDPQRTVVHKVDRVVSNIRRELQRDSSQLEVKCMRSKQHVQLTVYADLFGERPILLLLLRCLSESQACFAGY